MADTQEHQMTQEEPEAPEKLGAAEERKWPLKPEFTPDMLAEMEKLLPTKLNRVVAASMSGCIHCGMCSDACHYSVSIPEDKTLVPAYKLDRFRKWYKYRFDWMGRIFPAFVGAKPLTNELAEEMFDKLFGGCTMCRRCTYNCPSGGGLRNVRTRGPRDYAAGGPLPRKPPGNGRYPLQPRQQYGRSAG